MERKKVIKEDWDEESIEEQDLPDSSLTDEGEEERSFSSRFLKIVIALFLIIIIILMSIPYWALTKNPEPGPIPEIIVSKDLNFTTSRLSSLSDVPSLQTSYELRRAAVDISTGACRESDICYTKALYYYVRDRIQYIRDPPYEYIQGPEETMLGAGDCEDKAILLGMLLKSIGIRSRVVTIPGHAFLEVYMPEAPRRYKVAGNWVALDPTCTTCDFGEVPSDGKGVRTGMYPV